MLSFFFCLMTRSLRPGEMSALLVAQLAPFTALLLLGGCFPGRLQRATGPNTRSKDAMVLLVKAPGFGCISLHQESGSITKQHSSLG